MTQTQAGWISDAAGAGAYANVNGINLYYETFGQGRPLILLHGGLGATSMFGPNIGLLVEAGHQVIGVDLQGHGRTADIDRPIDVQLMAGDIAGLIEQLGLHQPDLVGYSLGAGTALYTAVQRPELVRRVVLTSVAMRDSAYYPELRAQQGQVTADAAELMKETPMYELYASLAPRVEDWRRLVAKIGDSMAGGFDHTAAFGKLQVPTLLVSADGDMAPPSHTVEIYELLGGGQRDGGWDKSGLPPHQLSIIPGETHYSIFNSPKLAAAVIPFLAQD